MNKRDHQGPGTEAPPSGRNGDGIGNPEGSPHPQKASSAPMHEQFKEKVRQTIAALPEVRPEKVDPLKEAVQQGTYEIDARKVANALITKQILDP